MRVAIVGVLINANEHNEFSVQLRSPGIIRYFAFALKQRSIVAAGRSQHEEQPIMFAECDPDGELHDRQFVILPTNMVLTTKDGRAARWVGTAGAPSGAIAHLFEIVDVS